MFKIPTSGRERVPALRANECAGALSTITINCHGEGPFHECQYFEINKKPEGFFRSHG